MNNKVRVGYDGDHHHHQENKKPGRQRKRTTKASSSSRRRTNKATTNLISLRKNPCFRALFFLISLQVFVLLLIVLFFWGDNEFPSTSTIISSRAQTLLLLRDYYVDQFRRYRHRYHHHRHHTIRGEGEDEDGSQSSQENNAHPGIVMDDDDHFDDDDVASRAPKNMIERKERGSSTRSGGEGADDDLNELEDHIANQTEEKLNQGQQQQQQQSSIDNYYERRKVKKKQQRQSSTSTTSSSFQFLIVGGSDGSGTRAFVTALGKLGVPMIVDDRGTMDIHGRPIFHKQGWPPLVQLVLNHTKTTTTPTTPGGMMMGGANYNIHDLPLGVQTTVIKELTKLKTDLIRRGLKHNQRAMLKQRMQQKGIHHHKVNHYPNNNNHYDLYRQQQRRPPNHLRHRRPASAVSAYKQSEHQHQHQHQPTNPTQNHPDDEHRMLLGHPSEEEHEEDGNGRQQEEEELVDVDPDVVNKALNRSELVQFGWKAPVSMLLLPFLREVFGPIKFLHVVRDGRDIAISANQSPVKKFYDSYHHHNQQQHNNQTTTTTTTTTPGSLNNDTATMNLRAMELWNDWNLQVLEYEKQHANDADFDYLVMRTEDLLDPEKKFQCLQQLAHFVGSRHTQRDMCCQSQQAVVDMGESSPNMGDGGGKKRNFMNKRGRPPQSHHHGPAGHIIDSLFGRWQEHQNEQQKTNYLSWFQNRRHNKNTNRHPQNDEELEEEVHQVLTSAGDGGAGDSSYSSSSSTSVDNRQHPVMGADPILSFAHSLHDNGGGDWNSNGKYFDIEEGRHRNWHHGKMDAGTMMEDAKARRMEDLRRRNERYKALASRVAANNNKQRYSKTNHPPPVTKAIKSTNVMEFGTQQKQQHDLSGHQDPFPPPAEQQRKEKPGGVAHNEVQGRRRLLSSFNKFQRRHNPHRVRKENKEDTRGPSEKEQYQEQAQSASGRQAEEQPVGGEPGTSWSFKSSAIQNLMFGFSSSHQAGAANDDKATDGGSGKGLDPEVVEKFQHMPLMDTKEIREAMEDEKRRHGRKEKKPGNVKARYGKWVTYLQDKPELSRQLHEIGAKALEAFGYEPSAPFLDTSGIDDTFQCDSKVVCEDNTMNPQSEEDKKRAAWREKRDNRLDFVL